MTIFDWATVNASVPFPLLQPQGCLAQERSVAQGSSAGALPLMWFPIRWEDVGATC